MSAKMALTGTPCRRGRERQYGAPCSARYYVPRSDTKGVVVQGSIPTNTPHRGRAGEEAPSPTEKGSEAVSEEEREEFEQWLAAGFGPWIAVGLERGWIRCPQ